MTNESHMKSKPTATIKTIGPRFLLLIALFCIATTFSKAAQQPQQKASAPLQAQKTFATPQQASEALIQATETFNLPALKEILGTAGEDLVSSEDPVQDKNLAAAFATKAQTTNHNTLVSTNSWW